MDERHDSHNGAGDVELGRSKGIANGADVKPDRDRTESASSSASGVRSCIMSLLLVSGRIIRVAYSGKFEQKRQGLAEHLGLGRSVGDSCLHAAPFAKPAPHSCFLADYVASSSVDCARACMPQQCTFAPCCAHDHGHTQRARCTGLGHQYI